MESARRRTLLRTAVLIVGATVLQASRAAAQTAPDTVRTAAEGVYTAEQASRGEMTFRSSCGNCHGTAQFSGAEFRKLWTGRTAYELFDQLRNTMPLDNPGGFSAEEYTAVIAYLLSLNRYPAGASSLPATDAGLKLVRF